MSAEDRGPQVRGKAGIRYTFVLSCLFQSYWDFERLSNGYAIHEAPLERCHVFIRETHLVFTNRARILDPFLQYCTEGDSPGVKVLRIGIYVNQHISELKSEEGSYSTASAANSNSIHFPHEGIPS
ncbi:hypothetical protein cyc_04788 [Cyclospora cayetanensis]|uniref:Uncharacterized protein n=1 Tax=Cyclospora cayetanensis TaxID=88456 RepID=A0A1D3D5P0_9EIME|nr:hypothetical protein cyc_04788 [Cyclospora cayetanensis]